MRVSLWGTCAQRYAYTNDWEISLYLHKRDMQAYGLVRTYDFKQFSDTHFILWIVNTWVFWKITSDGFDEFFLVVPPMNYVPYLSFEILLDLVFWWNIMCQAQIILQLCSFVVPLTELLISFWLARFRIYVICILRYWPCCKSHDNVLLWSWYTVLYIYIRLGKNVKAKEIREEIVEIRLSIYSRYLKKVIVDL